MQTTNRDENLMSEIRTFLRLRLKHSPTSAEARSYRHTIIDHVRLLRAFRLARQANTDHLLPPLRKKSSRPLPRPSDEPSKS